MPLAFFVTVLLAYLPYLSVGPLKVFGFLGGYASERGMVSGEQFFLLVLARQFLGANVPTIVYLVFVCAVLGLLSLRLIQNQGDSDLGYLRNSLIMASVFIVLLSPHFSWYFAWLIPFLCFIPSLPVFYLTLASFLLYLTWLGDSHDRVLMLKALVFVPALIVLLLVKWWRRRNE